MHLESVPDWDFDVEDMPRLLAGRGRSTIKTPTQWRRHAKSIRAKVVKMLGPPPARRLALQAEVLEERPRQKYVRLKVRYRVEVDDWVSAYCLVPHRLKAKAPAVLCCHQTFAAGKREPVGLEGKSTLAYAHHLAERGYVTLAPDCITAGERVTDLGPYQTGRFYEKHPGWSAVGKMLWDHQRGLDYLASLDFVDAARLGCIGHSLGGHNSIFLAAFDERVKAAVSSCGYQPIRTDNRPLRWSRDRFFIYIKKLRPHLLKRRVPFDFHEVIALIGPRAFLNLSGRGDGGFPNWPAVEAAHDRVREVYDLLGAGESVANHIHNDGHALLARPRRLAYDWLDHQLRR